jgi:DNA-binding response OmpR family regulator
MGQVRKKILCIEDDQEIAALIAEELDERGFDVRIARDGPEGVSAIMQLRPDVVLSDICMPSASGFEVLKQLTTAMPHLATVPFIFLTGMTDDDVERTARQLGAEGFITKPVDFDALEAVIRGHLSGLTAGEIAPERANMLPAKYSAKSQ